MQNSPFAPGDQPINPFIDFTTIPVSSLAQLQEELENAGEFAAIELMLTTGFPITSAINIQYNQTVSITSDEGGPYTLTRGMNGPLINVIALAGGQLMLSDVIIDGNSAAYPTSGGQLVLGEYGSIITIGEGTQLVNNHQTGSGGAVYISNGTLSMTGGRIAGNRGTFGGGIAAENSFIYMFGGAIENNEAASGGGGLSIEGGALLMQNSVVSGNTAQFTGGGIRIAGTTGSFGMAGSVLEDNTSLLGDGGGIYLASSNPDMPIYAFSGDSFIAGNAAPGGNGGAIGHFYDDALERIDVGPEVIFTENYASQAYLISPDDIPLHNAHVLTHSFTAPFEYGYNNFDIQYTEGAPVTLVTLSFETNSGTQVPSQIVISGTAAAQPANPTRAGYTFCGWFSNPELTAPFSFASPVTASTTLYACWQPAVSPGYTVNFNSNGGTPVPSQTVPAGSPAIMPANPTRGGDIFAGWYTSPDFATPWNFASPVTANMTLYARWMTAPCRPCRPHIRRSCKATC